MTTTNDAVVFDKEGKRVRRSNGVLMSGDRLVTSISLIDGAPRTGLTILDVQRDAVPTREQLQKMHDARKAALSNAWRAPASGDALPTAPPTPQSREDALAQRDQRLREAWRS
ncbi:hypothetical protein BSZ21_10225 [Bradyrhizobium canariense]|uniref:hypothetical protein n=1 Tax=Bradyrhizobium canariense TaxID=255045 RepID=UPI000A19131B|nr:hypothetical protein [Bradyrhizobium canariense]OSI70977.1 hypothetical protein BSZ21_10225 [Bradyrhizobium canariense]